MTLHIYVCPGFEVNHFWTYAMKDAFTTTWYWETTGAEITEFFWGLSQPKYDDPYDLNLCISIFIHPENLGWYDNLCTYWKYGVICE